MIEIIAFAGTLPYPGKNRVTGVFFGNIADQLLHDHGLAGTGTTEGSDFTPLGKRRDKINHFNASFENTSSITLLN